MRLHSGLPQLSVVALMAGRYVLRAHDVGNVSTAINEPLWQQVRVSALVRKRTGIRDKAQALSKGHVLKHEWSLLEQLC